MKTKLYSRDDLCFILYAMLQGCREHCPWAGIENVNWTEVDGIELPKSVTLHNWWDEDDTKTYIVTLNDVEATIARVASGEFELNSEIREWIASGDAGMIDAEAGDCLMQFVCFGELVFAP